MLLAWGVGSDTRWGEADRSMQLSKVLQLSQLSQLLPRTCRFAHPPASQESYIKWNLNDGQQSQLTRWSNNIKKMKVKQLFEWNIFGAFQVFWNRRKKKKKILTKSSDLWQSGRLTSVVLGSKARVKNLAQTNWGSGQANMSSNEGSMLWFRRDLSNILVHGAWAIIEF